MGNMKGRPFGRVWPGVVCSMQESDRWVETRAGLGWWAAGCSGIGSYCSGFALCREVWLYSERVRMRVVATVIAKPGANS